MTDENETAEQTQIAHQTAQNICIQVAADLTQKGIAATCLQRGVPPTGNNVLIMDGQFTDISEGNKLRRMVIGLGAGASKLGTVVEVIQKSMKVRPGMDFKPPLIAATCRELESPDPRARLRAAPQQPHR